MADMPAILVAEEDFNRLSTLIEKQGDSDVADGLENELSRATLVPLAEMPAHVVTMNSSVRFQNTDSGKEHELTLVYPHEVGTGDGKISILAPAGSALLGLSVGESIEWPIRGRANIHLKIINVTRQG
ncbi:regulator of nucleoside diphosphate kinase [Marinobacter sp. LV10R510-11A]|uniref:nucleoside diphosphate kinase regulator n=1 Tax=Marinobacter sp. LV10R510-11A TaxID=1415568 RepID=UPI000BB8F307|nr:nucleoside diphosphate kinase regulator [Marinobacter sp. LV10R510-11A]SOB76062.1 regulator of nucleoside diphosphate kinase [Marinobacter sp. LV10R510-11A]